MTFTITIPTYRTYVNIYISNSQKKLNRWNNGILSYFNDTEESFKVRGRSYGIYINEDGFRCADIVLRKSTLSFGVIAHEVMHCVNFILNYLDIPLTPESEEAYTCLNEYLIESIHRELNSKL